MKIHLKVCKSEENITRKGQDVMKPFVKYKSGPSGPSCVFVTIAFNSWQANDSRTLNDSPVGNWD